MFFFSFFFLLQSIMSPTYGRKKLLRFIDLNRRRDAPYENYFSLYVCMCVLCITFSTILLCKMYNNIHHNFYITFSKGKRVSIIIYLFTIFLLIINTFYLLLFNNFCFSYVYILAKLNSLIFYQHDETHSIFIATWEIWKKKTPPPLCCDE